jgi:hypothetical protein
MLGPQGGPNIFGGVLEPPGASLAIDPLKKIPAFGLAKNSKEDLALL